jgi:Na+/melibiose symporter-like transporter
MYGVLFMITQYFQLVHGYSPLGASLRTLPIAVIMIVVSPFTPRLSARFGAHRTVAFGMFSISLAFGLLATLGVHSPYAFMVVCFIPLTGGIALTMSPMTASIMSAVPARRAGAGSAMNDATRELGAALGIAVLGSVAVSRYDARIAPYLRGLSAAQRSVADTSIAGALRVADRLPDHASAVLTAGSKGAFVSGLHFAAIAGALLALCAGLIVLKYLPHSLVPEGAVRGPIESVEDMAEFGIAGGMPVFADVAAGDDGVIEERSA